MSFISEETKYNKSEYIFQESDIGVKLFIFMTKTLIKIRKSIMGGVPITRGNKDLAMNSQIH